MISPLSTQPTRFDEFIQKIKSLLKWIKRQVELNEQYFTQSKDHLGKPYAAAGDIFYADLGVNVGAELDKERPVVVLQTDDKYIRFSNLVFVIPLSSNITPDPYKVIIDPQDILENDGILKSTIVIQQARSISKNRIYKYKGKLNKPKLIETLLIFNRFLLKDNPLLKEGYAQSILADAAKSVL